jgi:hypothetical protein
MAAHVPEAHHHMGQEQDWNGEDEEAEQKLEHVRVDDVLM